MGVRLSTATTTTQIAAPPASGAETILATTPPLIIPYDDATVLIIWNSAFDIGTGTTSYTENIRRGTTTGGTLLRNLVAVQCTAGNRQSFAGFFIAFGEPSGAQQYSLSYSGAATTGAWTQRGCSLAAIIL